MDGVVREHVHASYAPQQRDEVVVHRARILPAFGDWVVAAWTTQSSPHELTARPTGIEPSVATALHRHSGGVGLGKAAAVLAGTLVAA